MLPGSVVCAVKHHNLVRLAGTEEERGLKLWRENLQQTPSVNQTEASSYDLPFGMATIRKCTWAHRVPFSPTFGLDLSVKKRDMRAEALDDYIVETIADGTLVSEKGNDNLAYNDFKPNIETKM